MVELFSRLVVQSIMTGKSFKHCTSLADVQESQTRRVFLAPNNIHYRCIYLLLKPQAKLQLYLTLLYDEQSSGFLPLPQNYRFVSNQRVIQQLDERKILQNILLSKSKSQPSGLTFGTWTKVQVHVYNRQNHSIREEASIQISLFTLYMCFQHTTTTSKMSSLHPVASHYSLSHEPINDFILIPKSVIVSQVYNMNYALHQLHFINSSFPFAFLTENTECFKETVVFLYEQSYYTMLTARQMRQF